jgi:hypothetical protein
MATSAHGKTRGTRDKLGLLFLDRNEGMPSHIATILSRLRRSVPRARRKLRTAAAPE